MKPSFSRRELLFHAFVLLILSGLVVWLRTSTVRETYAFVQTEKRLALSKQNLQALRLKWIRLTAPSKLVGHAGMLSMAPPKIGQLVKYSSLKVKGR